ncbi:hypothetical protein NIES4101_53700 [Calothrix sp. NIES-4101]|nr:hypothetical protein NIES4101_53700 [Calothrix sp. NIES-4101]
MKVEDYFRYYPTQSSDRKRKHERIQSLCIEFAQAIDAEIDDEECKRMALFALQQCRMFANQGITIDEMRKDGKV